MINKEFNVMCDDSPIDVTGEINFILSIANKLRGPYQSDKYKDVIIPMTIIRRFECALAKTKDVVVKEFNKDNELPEINLCKIAEFQFFNKSA